MKIVQAPDTVLSAKAQPVKKIDKDVKELVAGMTHAMLTASDPEGVGIAAPQVGKSLQIFVIKPEKSGPITTFINPKIELEGDLVERKSKKGGDMLEGCLSIKDVWGTVKRAKKVKVTYTDQHGKKHTESYQDWPARVIQHEYDHLQGVLFPRRVLEQDGKLYKSHKDKNGDDVFDLVEL